MDVAPYIVTVLLWRGTSVMEKPVALKTSVPVDQHT
jgi:hypothetical protein